MEINEIRLFNNNSKKIARKKLFENVIIQKNRALLFYFVLFISGFMLLTSSPAFAVKSSVEIEVPKNVKNGTEITIKVKISHNGNNLFHYTDWVSVKAGSKEIARWEYSMFSLPKDEVFIKEIKYTVNGTVDIEAEANCNIHGSAGKKSVKLKIK